MKLADRSGWSICTSTAICFAVAACRAPEALEPHQESGGSALREDAQNSLRRSDDTRLASLRLRVVEKETGRPIAGEDVDIWPANVSSHWIMETRSSPAHLNEIATTDHDGWVEFVLPAGDYSADISGGDDSNASVNIHWIAGGENREIVVRVATRNDIVEFGRIIDAETGEPIAGARVQVIVSSDTSPDALMPPVVLSSSDGSFRLDAASWREPIARVSALGFVSAVVDISDEYPDVGHPIVVELSRPASLIARVVDDAGTPISRAYVRMATAQSALDRQGEGSDPTRAAKFPTWSQRTEKDGRCTLDGLVPGVPLFVEVDAPNRVPRRMESITLAPRESREITLTVSRGTSISGVIEDQSHHVAQSCGVSLVPADWNRRVLLHPYRRAFARVVSDEKGWFRFDDVPDGLWWIGAMDDGEDDQDEGDVHLIAPVGQPLLVAATPVDMVLHVDRGLYVSGTVLDPDGEPAEDIEVDVEGDGLCFYGETDHSGRFAVGPLCDGTWTVVAGEATSYAPSVPVQATSKSAGLVLQLRPAGQIRVRVIDDATTRACDANVEVASENEARVTCDPENDEFVGGGLAEGSYTVYAVTQDHRVASAAGIALAAGATVGPIVVHLRPAATVRAKYTGKRTSMRCTLGVGPISIETVELAPGEEVEIADVPEDAYLELRDASNVVERRELHLAPGERREVVFTQP